MNVFFRADLGCPADTQRCLCLSLGWEAYAWACSQMSASLVVLMMAV